MSLFIGHYGQRTGVATVIVSLLVALAGCGGGGKSDEDEVKANANEFVDALLDNDGKRACDLMTDDGAKQLGQSGHDVAGATGCADFIVDVNLPSGKVTNVDVDPGGRARATLTSGSLSFVKEGGDWKIEHAP